MISNVQLAAPAERGNVTAGIATLSFTGILGTAVQEEARGGVEEADGTATDDKTNFSGPAINPSRRENKATDVEPLAIATAAPVFIPQSPLSTTPTEEVEAADSAATKQDATSSETEEIQDVANEFALDGPDRLIGDSSNASKSTGRLIDHSQRFKTNLERRENRADCTLEDESPEMPVSVSAGTETPARIPDSARVPHSAIQAFTVNSQVALSHHDLGRAASMSVFQAPSEEHKELAKDPGAAITLGGGKTLLPNCIQSPGPDPTVGISRDQSRPPKLQPGAPLQPARETDGGENVVAGARISKERLQRSELPDVKGPAAVANSTGNQVLPVQLQSSQIHNVPCSGGTGFAVSSVPVHAPIPGSGAATSIDTGTAPPQQPAMPTFGEPRSDPGAAHLVTRLEHQELRFGWNSPAFGRIEVRTSVEHNRVNAVISVPDSQLRDSLQAEMGSLHRALANHSLELSHFSTDSGASRNTPPDAEPQPYTNHSIWNTERERKVSAPQVSITIGAHIGLLDLRA